MTSLLRVGI